MIEKLRLDIDVGGNFTALNQVTSKFKEANSSLEHLLYNADKLNNKSITVQIREQIKSSIANDPLFKRIDFMPDKSIRPQQQIDILGNIKRQMEEERRRRSDTRIDQVSGIIGAIAGGGGLSSLTSGLGGAFGGPLGSAIGLAVGKVTEVITETLIKTVKGMGELTLSFSKQVVDSAAYRQDTIQTLSKFTGDKESATKEFNLITRIADKTSFGTKEISDLTTRLYLQNFKKEEVDTLRGRALDIASLHGANPKVLDDYANAIGKIKGKGRFTGEVEQLDLIEKFLPGGADQLRIQIGKQLGLKGKDQSIKDQVEKLVKARRVDSTTAISAINELIAGKTSGVAGGYSREAATKSISGAISNFQDAFSNTLLRIDWENSPGLNAFRKFLLNVSDAIGSKEFQFVIKDLAEAIFGGFDKINKEDIISWFREAEGAIIEFSSGVKVLWETLQDVISGKSSLLYGFVDAFTSIIPILTKFMVAAVEDAVFKTNNFEKLANDYREEIATKNEAKVQQAWLDKQDQEASMEEYRKRGTFVEAYEPVVKQTIYVQKVDARGNKSVKQELAKTGRKAAKASGRAGKDS